MFHKILFLSFFSILFVSCTETTDSDNNQERLNTSREEAKKQEQNGNNQMEDNQDNYEVRRIPANEEKPKPDND